MIQNEPREGAIEAPVPRHVSRLTRRELEIVQLAAEGLTNAQIANRLNVTVHGVKFHLASVYRKLDVCNRTEAAVAYLRATGA